MNVHLGRIGEPPPPPDRTVPLPGVCAVSWSDEVRYPPGHAHNALTQPRALAQGSPLQRHKGEDNGNSDRRARRCISRASLGLQTENGLWQHGSLKQGRGGPPEGEPEGAAQV